MSIPEDVSKYRGQWIVLSSDDPPRVIAHGPRIEDIMEFADLGFFFKVPDDWKPIPRPR